MGIKINAIQVATGSKIVGNDVYLKHFELQDKDVKYLMEEIMGRKNRYMLAEGETMLGLVLDSVEGALKKANLNGNDVDMIVYSSSLPEFSLPPTSIYIHSKIDGGKNVTCYDMNGNCAGMIVALEQVSNTLKHSNRKRALIIGCDNLDNFSRPDNELSYGNYGHASCAIILEKTDEDCDILGCDYFINSSEVQNITFPPCGFSNLFKVQSTEELRMNWLPFDGSLCTIAATNSMNKLIKANSLKVEDISMFCFSQFAYKNIELIRQNLNIPEEKSIYIGDEYGYTCTSSPFIVLNRAIEEDKVKRGDYVMFWTVGAGSQSVALLIKY